MSFDTGLLANNDLAVARIILGCDKEFRDPDLIIAPDGAPYLYRWHVIPRNERANVYFHIQVESDPERPLHDHPWDNMSVILSGGYQEVISYDPKSTNYDVVTFLRKPGDVIQRKAEEAHRLILPAGTPYTMSLFSTGPKRRAWGFWCEGKPSNQRNWVFVPAHEFIETR